MVTLILHKLNNKTDLIEPTLFQLELMIQARVKFIAI